MEHRDRLANGNSEAHLFVADADEEQSSRESPRTSRVDTGDDEEGTVGPIYVSPLILQPLQPAQMHSVTDEFVRGLPLSSPEITGGNFSLFSTRDTKDLLRGKMVVFFGDSVVRSMYKDLVHLCTCDSLAYPFDLQRKAELKFERDMLIKGDKLQGKDPTNGVDFQEIRMFLPTQADLNALISFNFVTRIWNNNVRESLEQVYFDSSVSYGFPDVIFVNSCLWDLTRGDKFRDQDAFADTYGREVNKFIDEFLFLSGGKTSLVFISTLPVGKHCTGAFLSEKREDNISHGSLWRYVKPANDVVRRIVRRRQKISNTVPLAYLDLHSLACNLQISGWRENDGTHWKPQAHRIFSFAILQTMANIFGNPRPPPGSFESFYKACDDLARFEIYLRWMVVDYARITSAPLGEILEAWEFRKAGLPIPDRPLYDTVNKTRPSERSLDKRAASPNSSSLAKRSRPNDVRQERPASSNTKLAFLQEIPLVRKSLLSSAHPQRPVPLAVERSLLMVPSASNTCDPLQPLKATLYEPISTEVMEGLSVPLHSASVPTHNQSHKGLLETPPFPRIAADTIRAPLRPMPNDSVYTSKTTLPTEPFLTMTPVVSGAPTAYIPSYTAPNSSSTLPPRENLKEKSIFVAARSLLKPMPTTMSAFLQAESFSNAKPDHCPAAALAQPSSYPTPKPTLIRSPLPKETVVKLPPKSEPVSAASAARPPLPSYPAVRSLLGRPPPPPPLLPKEPPFSNIIPEPISDDTIEDRLRNPFQNQTDIPNFGGNVEQIDAQILLQHAPGIIATLKAFACDSSREYSRVSKITYEDLRHSDVDRRTIDGRDSTHSVNGYNNGAYLSSAYQEPSAADYPTDSQQHQYYHESHQVSYGNGNGFMEASSGEFDQLDSSVQNPIYGNQVPEISRYQHDPSSQYSYHQNYSGRSDSAIPAVNAYRDSSSVSSTHNLYGYTDRSASPNQNYNHSGSAQNAYENSSLYDDSAAMLTSSGIGGHRAASFQDVSRHSRTVDHGHYRQVNSLPEHQQYYTHGTGADRYCSPPPADNNGNWDRDIY